MDASTPDNPYYVIIVQGFPQDARDDLLGQLAAKGYHVRVFELSQEAAVEPLAPHLAVWQVELHYLEGSMQRRLPGVPLGRVIHLFYPQELHDQLTDVFGPFDLGFAPGYSAIRA